MTIPYLVMQVDSFHSDVAGELLANQQVSLMPFIWLIAVFALWYLVVFWWPKKKRQPYTKMSQLQRRDKLVQIKARLLIPMKFLKKLIIKESIDERPFSNTEGRADEPYNIQSTTQEQQRYNDTLRLITQIDRFIHQDNSGYGYEKELNSLVSLSPESIKAISDIWCKNLRASEPTDKLLVEVLAQIAKERPPNERKLAIGALQKALDLPDDNTTRPMRRRNACIRKLDKLNALPGVEYAEEQTSEKTEPFQLEPIDAGEIGPLKDVRDMPHHDRANLEASALWELAHPGEHCEEEVIRKFESNYARWSKTFDPRSLSLVLCAYGLVLERLERYSEAVLALRWSCKIYPCKGFTACDVLHKVEAKAVEAGNLEIVWNMSEEKHASIAKCGYIVLSIGNDFWFRLWDPTTWDCIGAFKAYSDMSDVALIREHVPFAVSSDDRLIAVPIAKERVAIWSLNSGTIEETLRILKGNLYLDFLGLAKDNSLMVGMVGFSQSLLEYYDYNTGYPMASKFIDLNGGILKALSPCRNFLAVVMRDEPQINIIEHESKKVEWLLHKPKGEVNHITFSTCGKLVACANNDGLIRIWDLKITPKVGEQKKVQEPKLSLKTYSEPLTVGFNQIGNLLITVDKSGNLAIYDIETAKEICRWRNDEAAVRSTCFTPDGKFVIAGCWDGTIKLWLTQGKQLRSTQAHTRGVGVVVCIPSFPDV